MNASELRRSISLRLDGALPAEDVRKLEEELLNNEESRLIFLNCMSVHAELCNAAAGREYVESLVSPCSTTVSDSSSNLAPPTSYVPSKTRWLAFSWLALAASLLVGVGLWQGSDLLRPDLAYGGEKQEPHTSELSLPILAAINPAGADCNWHTEEVKRSDVASYRAGDVFRVTKGKLALTYEHGTKVVLHSPAAFQLLTDMKAKMIVGRLTATVPKAGNGFSVITPQATVVDLGTEFGVEVGNDGATDVLVFKGEVDVDFHEDRAGQSRVQRLQMGEGVRLDAIGTRSRIVSINGLSYSDRAPDEHAQPAIITEVRDNIARKSLLSYYEIVPGGLKEDALAYVDRIAHEYNGITAAGMPEYLVGADYVKMFNSDKRNPEITIDITLAAPARLFVLLDKRLEPPQWLTDGFEETREDIGVDEGPYKSDEPGWHNKGPTGVGPGESVENKLSIWVKEVNEPGVVRLGPAAVDDEEGDSNMYGIAATPLVEE